MSNILNFTAYIGRHIELEENLAECLGNFVINHEHFIGCPPNIQALIHAEPSVIKPTRYNTSI